MRPRRLGQKSTAKSVSGAAKKVGAKSTAGSATVSGAAKKGGAKSTAGSAAVSGAAKKVGAKSTAKSATVSGAAKKAGAKSTAKSATVSGTAKKGGAKSTAGSATVSGTAKKTAPKTKAKPTPKPKPIFDKKFLDQQAELLTQEREKYQQSSVSLESEAQQLLETREQGDVQFDEESSEGNSWAIVRDQDLVLSAEARATVEKIDQALLRIKDGTYGICERTGKPIPKARLKAIPWATQRVGQKTHGLLSN